MGKSLSTYVVSINVEGLRTTYGVSLGGWEGGVIVIAHYTGCLLRFVV